MLKTTFKVAFNHHRYKGKDVDIAYAPTESLGDYISQFPVVLQTMADIAY